MHTWRRQAPWRAIRPGAKGAAAQAVRLDPNWSVEKYLSDSGGYPNDATTLFVDAARKAGVTAVCQRTSFRQCRTLFISRRATRRGLTKPLARVLSLHTKTPRLTFANVRLWH